MSMLSYLSNKIKYMDVLSEPPSLKRSKEDKYKTFIGGLFTVLVVLTSIVGTIFFGMELILKRKPAIVTADKQFKDVGPFEISNEQLNVLLKLSDAEFSDLINPRALQIRAFQQYTETDTSTGEIVIEEFTEVNIDICSKYYSSSSQFTGEDISSPLESTFCLDPSQKKIIRNFWGSQYYNSFRINIEKCVNKTSDNNFNPNDEDYLTNKNCYPQEEIDKVFEGATMNIYTSTTLIDSFNYSNPSSIMLKEFYLSLNNNLSLEIVFSYTEIDYYTDKGLIFTSYNKEKLFYIEKPNINYYDGKSRGNKMLDFTFELRKLGQDQKRSYTKIQDVITNIGGIVKALMLVGHFVSQFFSIMQYEIDSFLYYNNLIIENSSDSYNSNGGCIDSFNKLFIKNFNSKISSIQNNIDNSNIDNTHNVNKDVISNNTNTNNNNVMNEFVNSSIKDIDQKSNYYIKQDQSKIKIDNSSPILILNQNNEKVNDSDLNMISLKNNKTNNFKENNSVSNEISINNKNSNNIKNIKNSEIISNNLRGNHIFLEKFNINTGKVNKNKTSRSNKRCNDDSNHSFNIFSNAKKNENYSNQNHHDNHNNLILMINSFKINFFDYFKHIINYSLCYNNTNKKINRFKEKLNAIYSKTFSIEYILEKFITHENEISILKKLIYEIKSKQHISEYTINNNNRNKNVNNLNNLNNLNILNLENNNQDTSISPYLKIYNKSNNNKLLNLLESIFSNYN